MCKQAMEEMAKEITKCKATGISTRELSKAEIRAIREKKK